MTVVISQRRARIRARRQRRNDGNEWPQEEELEHHNSAIFPRISTYSHVLSSTCVCRSLCFIANKATSSVLLLAAGSRYLGQSDLLPQCSKNVQGNSIQDIALVISSSVIASSYYMYRIVGRDKIK